MPRIGRAKTDREVTAFVKRHVGRRAETTVGGEPGLSLRVAASGEVTYALRYRNKGGRQHTLTIDTTSLATARKEAHKHLAAALVGADPVEEKRSARLAVEEQRRSKDRTVTQMIDKWVGTDGDKPKPASREAASWRPSTRRETARLLRTHVVPAFGDRDPNALTRREVRHLLDKIAEDAPSEANHAFGALRGLYGWLLRERQEHLGVTANPTHGLEKPGGKPEPRARVYSDEEIRGILAAVRGTAIDDLVQLLFHTGTRDRETRGMRRPDVDQDRGVWTIPAELSKNGRPHPVALSTGALDVLKRRPQLGSFLFPNTDTATGHMDRPNSKVLRAVAIKAGLLRKTGKEDKPEWEGEALRLHDIRRTIGQRLRDQFGEATMHGALGHADAMLTRTYGPTPRLKVIAEAMEWWSAELKTILGATREREQA